MNTMRHWLTPFVLLISLTLGCAEPEGMVKPEPPPVEQPKESIIGRTTQDVGEYDPNGDDVVSELEVAQDASPLAVPAGAYKYATATLSKQRVQRDLQFFETINERYPKDHAEFMEEIVKKGDIHFPVLPGGRRYMYDVANHELIIVEAKKKDKAAPSE